MLEFLANGFSSLLSGLYSLLPTFDYEAFLSSLDSSPLRTGMGYLNYFVPVGGFLAVLSTFVTLIIGYNVFIVIKSWLKKVV